MPADQFPACIQFLLRPEAYNPPPDKVELVQTHISYVLLAGDLVYKIKKAVNFGFLDFSTLEKRHHCCQQELILNRRLCPDIYLDLVRITRQEKDFAINGNGPVVEYGVLMKRMPEDRMMSRLIDAGKLERHHIDALVDVLVPFYEHADHGPGIDTFGTAESVAVNVLENFDQTREFIGQGALTREQFDDISAAARKFLDKTAVFDQRIREGRIRDCHGDLYSANICLADKVYIYDCIEFNQRFRYCDVASDVAFLVMDLDFHNLTDFGQHFIDQFIARSADTSLPLVLNFYTCYRAYVRGKIGLFTANDPAVDATTRSRAVKAAQRYFALAHHYAGRM